MLLLVILLISIFVNSIFSSQEDVDKRWEGLEDIYPKHIPDYPVRKDFYSKKVVRRGRLELIHGLERAVNESQKVILFFIL